MNEPHNASTPSPMHPPSTDTPKADGHARTHPRTGQPPPYGSMPGYGDMPDYGYPGAGGGVGPGGGLLSLVATLWRHKLTAIFSVAAALGLAAWHVRTATPIYQSDALIEVSVRRPRIMRQEEALIEDSRIQVDDLRNAQIAKLGTATLRRRVLNRALEEQGNGTDPATVARWVNAISITPQRRSTLVAIIARHSEPQLAAGLANWYAQEAVRYVVEGNRALSDEAVLWLEAQAEAQQATLIASEEALLHFRTEQNADAIQAEHTLNRAAMVELNAQLTGILARKVDQDELLKALEALDETPQETRALPTSTPNLLKISTLLAAHQQLLVDEAALLRDYTWQHPTVTAKRAEVVAAEAELRRLFARALETVRANVTLQERQASALRREVDELGAKGGRLERKIHRAQAGIAALERDRDVSEAMYRGILNRIEEARLSADEETATIKIIEPAYPSSKPAEPRTVRIIALALLLGGAAGGGLALLTAFLRDRLWSPADIEVGPQGSAGLKVLGVVPHVERKHRPDVDRMVALHKFDRVSESFSVLRGTMATRMSGKTLVVTSPGPREGKTACACNLAIAHALAGRRVLLLDLDLRRPRLAAIWNIAAKDQSLLHALADEAAPDFPALAHDTDVPGLSVIVSYPSRRISPSQLLAGNRPLALLEWAAEHFDIVIVDTPPVGVAADALCVARHASAVLLVARFNSTRKRSLQAAWERLIDYQAETLGVVVNDVAFARHATFGYRHPWYGYYSGYHAYGKYAADKAQTPPEP